MENYFSVVNTFTQQYLRHANFLENPTIPSEMTQLINRRKLFKPAQILKLTMGTDVFVYGSSSIGGIYHPKDQSVVVVVCLRMKTNSWARQEEEDEEAS